VRSTLRSSLNLTRVRSTKTCFVSERFLSRARPARRQDGILGGILPTARKRKCFRRKPEFPTETVTAEGGLKGVTGWVYGYCAGGGLRVRKSPSVLATLLCLPQDEVSFSVFDLYKPFRLPPKGDYGAPLPELRNEGIDARAYRRLIR
jgi:hypothetical protein